MGSLKDEFGDLFFLVVFFGDSIMKQLISKDLGVDISNRIQQLKVEEPPKRKGGIKVANVAELVSKLKNESKVI